MFSLLNNTNLYNGLSFTYEHNQGKVKERSWAQLRAISDELCKEHDISVIEPIGKGVSHYENEIQKEGKSWKDKLHVRIAEVMLYSRDFADFLRNCTASGIEYVYTPQNKYKLKFRLSGEGQQRFTREESCCRRSKREIPCCPTCKTAGGDYFAQSIFRKVSRA